MVSHISKIAPGAGKIIGITGHAGAGKTTLAHTLGLQVYSTDYRFIGDSDYRKRLLERKNGLTASYVDACNQFNWWDWDSIREDLAAVKSGRHLTLVGAYDRMLGKHTLSELHFDGDEATIYEGAILGPDDVLVLVDHIFFIVCEASYRLRRMLVKDMGRRTAVEIAARFLITEYSENTYYERLFRKRRVTYIDDNGYVLSHGYDIPRRLYVPVEVRSVENSPGN